MSAFFSGGSEGYFELTFHFIVGRQLMRAQKLSYFPLFLYFFHIFSSPFKSMILIF